jgi:hypothetical protein
MTLDDGALPLTRGQLDLWLAQQTRHSGAKWQRGLFARIDGTVEPDLLEQANRQALQEAEQLGAAFLEMNGQGFHKAVDHPDVEFACYDLSCSQHPTQEACDIASSIQRAPMPLSGPVFIFASLQMRVDEFCLLGEGKHARLDGWGNRAVLPQSANAVGGPLIERTDRRGLTQRPPDQALTDSGRCWGGSFSSMALERTHSCSAISRFNGANVSDAGMPA